MLRETALPICILPTAVVRLGQFNVQTDPTRGLCDTGSQPNLITNQIVRKYGLRAKPTRTTITGLSCYPIKITRQINLKVYPWFDPTSSIELNFWVLPKEAKWHPLMPDRTIRASEVNLSKEMILADPLFWKPDNVQLLLGIEACVQIIEPSLFKVNEKLIEQQTKLGAVLMGSLGTNEPTTLKVNTMIQECNSKDIEQLIKKFWEIEEIPEIAKKSKEHQLVEKIFFDKYTRARNGRFSVPIPIDPKIKEIGDSRPMALKRFHILESRFDREPEFKEQYVNFMREYQELGHMIKVDHTLPKSEMTYYIPHHGIITSGKFKVVFDCSCKTNKKISLNDAQLLGPKLQKDLFEIVLRARRHKVALSVDVKKMFRQIQIIPEQWDLQRIFWRESKNEPLKEYWLVTVIYGQKSSPTSAIMVMQEGAKLMSEQYPRAAESIKDDFYMDDCFTGAATEAEALQIAEDLKAIFSSMGFSLDKWKSESIELVEQLKGDQEPILIEEQDNQSILGLKWDLVRGEFTYRVKETEQLTKWTRRTVLSKVASLFDPLGHLSPVIFTAKVFMQQLWRKTSTWDEQLSNELQTEWILFWSKIKSIEQVRIQRWLGTTGNMQIELYGYCDASAKGYGAVIYVRTESQDGAIKVIQLAAKSRVAPLKIISIPRLELLAAALLAKLIKCVLNSMEWENIPYFLYSDSKTVLQWINKEPIDLKTFVGNRVSAIQEYTNVNSWAHVRTKENPADLVSRGLMPDELADNELWWKGPKWLSQSKEQWPKPIPLKQLEEEPVVQTEMKVHMISKIKELTIKTNDGNIIPLLDYTNNLNKIQLIYSYILRFVKGLKSKTKSKIDKRRRKYKRLIFLPTNEEKGKALLYLVKREQQLAYAKELNGIMKGSEIESLYPIKDEQEILRVGGRLKHSACPYEMRVPMILPAKSRLSWLIIKDAHEETNHGHVQVMMQYIRARFWIPKLRLELRAFVQKCVKCKRYEHPMGEQLMGNLPFDRVNPCKPFLHTGVDYAGPILIKESLKTKTNKRKCWIVLFVCLNTRAIHLDIVTDLTSAAYIQCFKRFIGRRGACETLYSDNATTFVGASKELKEALKRWDIEETHKKLNSFGTKWAFMTAGAPHQGGIYEAGVKSTKYHLRRVIGNQSWTYEQYLTLLIEIEAILNSRPIYPLSDDPNDLQALTPGHFLFGEPLKVPARIDPPPNTNFTMKRIWAEAQSMKEHFWKRWVEEYLPTLQPRKKWRKENEGYKIGQLVIIRDENLPPAQWLLGRIIELIKGKDGLVRSVELKTESGKLSRPVQKICILPVEGAEVEQEKEQKQT